MKNTICLFLLLVMLACKEEELDVTFRTVYTSSFQKKVTTMEKRGIEKAASGDYIQFGDFLGTITPKKVTAKFHTIRYTDNTDWGNGKSTIVDVISTNWPEDDIRRMADFTNGNTMEVVPDMFGNIGNDGWFVENEIVLKYLGIYPQYFLFEFDLPAQFEGKPVQLDFQMPDIANREGNTMICKAHYFLQWVDQMKDIRGYVFGGTDSSYIVSQSNIPSWDVAELIRMAQPGEVARVGNFESPVLKHPPQGKSALVTTIVGFNSENLIQHYAGFDKLPYTYDDVFVFPPKFWERFQIKLEQN